jgi:hypothetical protein
MAPALGSEDDRQQSVASEDNDGWSLYGAPWLQPVAIRGKCGSPENARSKPKPLPWVATNGKEGVDGSSPSEGSEKSLLIRPFC